MAIELPRRIFRRSQEPLAADVSLIAQELGWTPTTRLEDGLAAQWAWAVDRVAAP